MWTQKYLVQIHFCLRADHNIYCQCCEAKQKLCHKYVQYVTITAQNCKRVICFSAFSIAIHRLRSLYSLCIRCTLDDCIFSPFIPGCRAMFTLWALRFLPHWALSSSQSWRQSWGTKSRGCWSRCRRRSPRTGRSFRYKIPADCSLQLKWCIESCMRQVWSN